jgi:hypothetical protein
MKIVELLNNVRLPITNEEADLLEQFDNSAIIPRQKFNERQITVANHLVTKDVLLRRVQDGQVTYQKKTKS